MRISAFLLSMLSPVLQKSVCGCFMESASKRVELEDVEPACFQRVLDLWCGRDGVEIESVRQLMRTAALAERYQVAEVVAVLENALIEQLSVDNCAEVLEGSAALGLVRAEAAAEVLALERFEEVAATKGFLRAGEEAVGRLVNSDQRVAGSEEQVLECVVRWMAERGEGGGGLAGRGLLRKVRFALMEEGYLAGEVEGRVPAEHREWARGAVEEARRAKRSPAEERGLLRWEHLGPKAATPRRVVSHPAACWGNGAEVIGASGDWILDRGGVGGFTVHANPLNRPAEA